MKISDKTKKRVETTKSVLQSVGSIAGAVSGVALGLLSIIRVFFPDPTNTKSEVQIGNGISELK